MFVSVLEIHSNFTTGIFYIQKRAEFFWWNLIEFGKFARKIFSAPLSYRKCWRIAKLLRGQMSSYTPAALRRVSCWLLPLTPMRTEARAGDPRWLKIPSRSLNLKARIFWPYLVQHAYPSLENTEHGRFRDAFQPWTGTGFNAKNSFQNWILKAGTGFKAKKSFWNWVLKAGTGFKAKKSFWNWILKAGNGFLKKKSHFEIEFSRQKRVLKAKKSFWNCDFWAKSMQYSNFQDHVSNTAETSNDSSP